MPRLSLITVTVMLALLTIPTSGQFLQACLDACNRLDNGDDYEDCVEDCLDPRKDEDPVTIPDTTPDVVPEAGGMEHCTLDAQCGDMNVCGLANLCAVPMKNMACTEDRDCVRQMTVDDRNLPMCNKMTGQCMMMMEEGISGNVTLSEQRDNSGRSGRTCRRRSDCRRREFCNRRGFCRRRGAGGGQGSDDFDCRRDRDCRRGQFCNRRGRCRDFFRECRRARDCNRGEICSRGRCFFVEDPPFICRRDRDCRRGHHCNRRGVCVRDRCRRNHQCGFNEFCAFGRCVRFGFRLEMPCLDSGDCKDTGASCMDMNTVLEQNGESPEEPTPGGPNALCAMVDHGEQNTQDEDLELDGGDSNSNSNSGDLNLGGGM